MLQTSRQNAAISAYAERNGKFDYNQTPLVPVGSNALIYNDPSDRTSFEANALKAIVVGQAILYYWCLKFWLPATRRFRISDTYRLYPAHCKIPVTLEVDETPIAAQDMLQAYNQLTLSAL